MNEVLSKAVEELAKDVPNIAYVRGMLETVLAMSPIKTLSPLAAPMIAQPKDVRTTIDNVFAPIPTTEAEMLDAQARAAIEQVKALHLASVEAP